MDEDAPTPESIGAYLAGQRRLRGISPEELARQTRIPLRSLERLEAGSFDGDVDGFVRGFVRTVAEALGLDPDEALNRTLPEPAHRGRRGNSPRLSLQRVLVAVLGVVLLGALGFGVQFVVIQIAGAARDSVAPVTIRHDPVRALAEAQGLGALSPAPALSLASEASPLLQEPERAASAPAKVPKQTPKKVRTRPRTTAPDQTPERAREVALPDPPAAPVASPVSP